jgi:acetyl esterase/lipase
MPTYRAVFTRFLMKRFIGRKYRKAGQSIPALRKLDDLMIRSQRPPRGTQVFPVDLNGLSGDWVQGPGAKSDGAILHLHGGAFVTGSPEAYRELAARISTSARMRVFSLDYRLAPEYPFPAALEDTLSAYRWLLNQGYPPSRLVVGGESSGGGLALQALLSMKNENVPLPAAAFFLSPVTDWVGLDGESYRSRATVDPLVFHRQCEFTASQYVGDHPSDAPLLRPARMDLTGLPAMWIQVGDHEVLLSDAEGLTRRATDAGVEVDFKVWPGLWHVFQGAARMVPEARDSLAELGRFVRNRVPEGSGPPPGLSESARTTIPDEGPAEV